MAQAQHVLPSGKVALLLMAAAVAGAAWVVSMQPSEPDARDAPPAPGSEVERKLVGPVSGSGRTGTTEPRSLSRLQEGGVVAKLQLPPGSCRLQPDAEGNVVGTCALPPEEPGGARFSPFGGSSWTKP